MQFISIYFIFFIIYKKIRENKKYYTSSEMCMHSLHSTANRCGTRVSAVQVCATVQLTLKCIFHSDFLMPDITGEKQSLPVAPSLIYR